jgi:hypothetical protein
VGRHRGHPSILETEAGEEGVDFFHVSFHGAEGAADGAVLVEVDVQKLGELGLGDFPEDGAFGCGYVAGLFREDRDEERRFGRDDAAAFFLPGCGTTSTAAPWAAARISS